jgi:hypothetical protein
MPIMKPAQKHKNSTNIKKLKLNTKQTKQKQYASSVIISINEVLG